MRKTPLVLALLFAAALVAAVSLALHYRAQSQGYLRQWALAEARAATVERAPEPTVAAPAARPAAAPVRGTVTPVDEAGPLRQRIAQLEAQLAEQGAQLAMLRQDATNRLERGVRGRERGPGMEAFRTNNPALAAEFAQRRLEAQQYLQDALARKTDFILKKDTSKLSEQDKAQYDQMVQLLDETWALAQQMQAELPADQRREAMRAFRDNMTALEPLLLNERTDAFQSLGASLGYNQVEAANFAAYLTDVIDLTSVRSLFPGFRPAGGGGRGPGAGGPPPAMPPAGPAP